MAVICGLDLATKSGVSVYDTNREPHEIITGCIDIKKEDPGESDSWRRAGIGNEIERFIKRATPIFGPVDFFVIETPINFQMKGGNAFLTAQALHGGVTTWFRNNRIPYGLMSSQSWHTKAYQKEDYPPKLPKLDKDGKVKFGKDGKPEFHSPDWKSVAVKQCIKLGIKIPKSLADGMEDAAEAAMMVMVWHHCTGQGPIGRDALMRLKLAAPVKVAAKPLRLAKPADPNQELMPF
jgi:hypothetical protein